MPAAHPSPNHGDRRGFRVELIVLHYTAMADAASARERLCDPQAEVSAHYLIARDGTTEALVCETRRAWHAGAGGWAGRDDVNSRSLGIELDNTGDQPFSEPQMAALEALLRDLMARHGLGPESVIGHSDMAPDRKFDPGARFDWARLARQGLALGAGPDGDGTADFQKSLDAIGYPPSDPLSRLDAFRLRHRPWARGPEDATDRALANSLARRASSSA